MLLSRSIEATLRVVPVDKMSRVLAESCPRRRKAREGQQQGNSKHDVAATRETRWLCHHDGRTSASQIICGAAARMRIECTLLPRRQRLAIFVVQRKSADRGKVNWKYMDCTSLRKLSALRLQFSHSVCGEEDGRSVQFLLRRCCAAFS